MEETISLKEIFDVLKKRLSLIISITLLAVAVGAFVTYFVMTPKYDASTQILVNQSDNVNIYNSNAVQTNTQLVNTYSVLINNSTVLQQAIDQMKLDMTTNELKDMLSVETTQDAQIFTLTAESESPALSLKIVDGVADAFKSQVQKSLNVDNITVLPQDTMETSSDPVSPRPAINLAIALVIGLMLSVGLAFLLEYLDNTIKTEEDIEQILGLPVLGAVSQMKDTHTHHSGSRSAAHSVPQHRSRGGSHLEAK